MYTQCRLEQKLSAGVRVQVAFIPTKFAVADKKICIKDQGEWTVRETYQSIKKAPKHSRFHKLLPSIIDDPFDEE